MLTSDQAIEIYRAKISVHNKFLTSNQNHDSYAAGNIMRGRSNFYSRLYGVSTRTIRDVWNRKTWAHVTQSMWCEELGLSQGRTSDVDLSTFEVAITQPKPLYNVFKVDL